jgi:hypothetical protein
VVDSLVGRASRARLQPGGQGRPPHLIWVRTAHHKGYCAAQGIIKMTDRIIFISCGQQRPEEKELGTVVKNLIDSKPGYRAYFAEYVQSLDALAKNVFDGLRKCSGLIAFLHERGFVKVDGDKEWGYRSSVWVNQEISILSYRKQFEGIDIPILVFKDKSVRLEGAMTSLIVNPIPIVSKEDIIMKIDSWLQTAVFSNSAGPDESFLSKWQKLSPSSKKVLSALIDEGGRNVKKSAIRICLREKYGMEKNESSSAVSTASIEFINTDLVKLISNIHSGDEMSLNPTWQWHIRREVAKDHKAFNKEK